MFANKLILSATYKYVCREMSVYYVDVIDLWCDWFVNVIGLQCDQFEL